MHFEVLRPNFILMLHNKPTKLIARQSEGVKGKGNVQ
jgi:hypothetical protein